MIDVSRIPVPLASAAGGFTLDGGGSGSRWDRWSYRPGAATRELRCDGGSLVTTLRSARGEERRWEDPLKALAWLGEECSGAAVAGPPFKSGWVGYLSYDLGRLFETIPTRAADDLGLPLFVFTRHDSVTAIDHHRGVAYLSREARDEGELVFPGAYRTSDDPPRANFERGAYEGVVGRALEYVGAGDVFQVNLAQRFTAGLRDSPANLYAALLRRFPAWFGAFLDYGDHALLCNSPELFLKVTPGESGRRVLTRPIKGTRPRGPGMDRELRDSPKEQAELNMVIDLERNDLGRVCEVGSVRVTEPREIESHPTVYHGAATIEGTLRADVTFVDLLRATFPGGSVTGAPKVRAMEIIEELEPVRRGPYCGAIGYLSGDGHAQFNVAIRTMVARGDRVHFSVGGGIVADSDPAREYDETIVKARAMTEVLGRRA